MLRLLLQAGHRRMTAWTLVFLCLVVAADGFSSKATHLRPERQIDLSFLGKVAVPPLNHLIEFVDEDTIAVAVVVHNPRHPELVRRGEFDEYSAFFLHAALLDANSGQILKQDCWPTDYPRHSGFLAAFNSDLLVLRGNLVALYSNKLELQNRLTLPGDGSRVWIGRASPSGRNALFIEDAGLKPAMWIWVDATRLRVLRIWKAVPRQPGGFGSPISDKYITFTKCLPPGGVPPCKLTVRPVDGNPARTVADLSPRYGPPQFVSGNLLFAHRLLGGISITNLARQREVRRYDAGIGKVYGPAVSAPEAARFVVPVFGQTLQLEHLYIFDGPLAHLRVLRVDGLASSKWTRLFEIFPTGFAISPDGMLLATMMNFKTLLIFRLPPPQAH